MLPWKAAVHVDSTLGFETQRQRNGLSSSSELNGPENSTSPLYIREREREENALEKKIGVETPNFTINYKKQQVTELKHDILKQEKLKQIIGVRFTTTIFYSELLLR